MDTNLSSADLSSAHVSPADETNRLLEENVSGNGTLIFNVGGVIFETYRSTLTRIQSGPLADDNFLKESHRPEKNDYFFDRDPDAFKIVVNYLRTGQVFIPSHIDSPFLRKELLFWGLTPELEVIFTGHVSLCRSTVGQITCVSVNDSISSQNEKGNIWNILSNPDTSLLAKIYAGISYALMFLSVIIFVAATTPLLQTDPNAESNASISHAFEDKQEPDALFWATIVSLVCCLFFTAEYILRLLYSPNKKRFIFSFLGIIDCLAVLTEFFFFFLELVIETDWFFRLFRVFTIFRILRLLRIFKHFKVMFETDIFLCTLKYCFGQLIFIAFLSFILVALWGTLAYSVEFHSGNYVLLESIPSAFWWAVITMTTVGYGDVFPETIQGKIVASLCAACGPLMIGLLVASLVNGMFNSTRQIQGIMQKTQFRK